MVLTVGDRIKQYRISNNLTQKELGKLIGTTQQMIAQYENNRRKPKIETLDKIAQALHTSIESLCRRTYYFGPTEFFPMHVEKIPVINSYYNKLNHLGKMEAIKRVSELVEIKKYTDPDIPNQDINIAEAPATPNQDTAEATQPDQNAKK